MRGMSYTFPSDVWSMGLILSEIENLHLVVARCSSSEWDPRQLFRVWKMCHAVGATQQGESFEVRVRQELNTRLPWSALRRKSRCATLGRVYGPHFAAFVRMFLYIDPSKRSSFVALDARSHEMFSSRPRSFHGCVI